MPPISPGWRTRPASKQSRGGRILERGTFRTGGGVCAVAAGCVDVLAPMFHPRRRSRAGWSTRTRGIRRAPDIVRTRVGPPRRQSRPKERTRWRSLRGSPRRSSTIATRSRVGRSSQDCVPPREHLPRRIAAGVGLGRQGLGRRSVVTELEDNVNSTRPSGRSFVLSRGLCDLNAGRVRGGWRPQAAGCPLQPGEVNGCDAVLIGMTDEPRCDRPAASR